MSILLFSFCIVLFYCIILIWNFCHNQTIKIDEILILNDGSTDNTLLIIKEYELNNDNVRVLNIENWGFAAGRPPGLHLNKDRSMSFKSDRSHVDL